MNNEFNNGQPTGNENGQFGQDDAGQPVREDIVSPIQNEAPQPTVTQSVQADDQGERRYIPDCEQIPQFRASIPNPSAEEPAPRTYPNQQQFVPDPPPQKKKAADKKNLGSKTIVMLICLSLLGGLLGGVLTGNISHLFFLDEDEDSTVLLEGQRENVQIDIHKIDTSKAMTPAEVYAANVNSTVGITTSVTTNFWGQQTTSAASGSGFIISADGYILTNYHVIEGSSSVTVSFFDGSSVPATIVGYEANNDIAILKVEAENLTPVVLGDSDNLNVGDSVLAIGNPLGELTFTLTSGIVSALDRDVTTSSGISMTLIQTDCAINSGNSGGALFNLHGEVVGITNAKYSSSSNAEASIDNIGFAIPMNQVKKIVSSVLEKGYYTKPYIGVSVTDVSEETQSYGLPKGAAVKSVSAGAPADIAGLQINDIITKVNDTEITGSNDLVKRVGEAEIGEVLKLTVYRMGAYVELSLTVGEQQQAGTQQQQQQQQPNYPGYFNPFG